MAANVAEEVTRKVFMGRVRERNVGKRWWAPNTAAAPYGGLVWVFMEEKGGEGTMARPAVPPRMPPFTVAW